MPLHSEVSVAELQTPRVHVDKVAKVMREEQTAESSGGAGLAYTEVCTTPAWVPEITKLSSLKLSWACLYSLEYRPIHKQPHGPLLCRQHRPCFCIVVVVNAVNSITCPVPKRFLCHSQVPWGSSPAMIVTMLNGVTLSFSRYFNLLLKLSVYHRCFLTVGNCHLLTVMPKWFKNLPPVNWEKRWVFWFMPLSVRQNVI